MAGRLALCEPAASPADGKHRDQGSVVMGREPDWEIMGHPQKATESWSFWSSDLAGECVQDCFSSGNEKAEPWALAVGDMIPRIFLPCWIVCQSPAQNHSTQCEGASGSSFLHRDLFQKGSPKPLTRLGSQLLAWEAGITPEGISFPKTQMMRVFVQCFYLVLF